MAELTIGLPIYNGGKSLAQSIDRLLAQTYGDFALVISDNASTDGSADICAEYAKRDGRIRYIRQVKNMGWSENFRFTLFQAETPFFMWATHDDIWLPRFAEENIALLKNNTNAICSVSKVIYFSLDGNRVQAPDTGELIGTPAQRLKRFFLVMQNCARLYGVYRTDVLKRSFPSDLHLFASDWLIVALTLLHGDHVEVDEPLLEREARPAEHYLRAFGRIDGFDPDWLDWLVPLRRFNVELRRRLPPQVWKDINLALTYINIRHMVAMSEYRAPVLRRLIRPMRNLAASALHQRWR